MEQLVIPGYRVEHPKSGTQGIAKSVSILCRESRPRVTIEAVGYGGPPGYTTWRFDLDEVKVS